MAVGHHDSGNIPYDFLNTEIELATTFIHVAKTELSIDPEHVARALDKAREAIETVRHFSIRSRFMSSVIDKWNHWRKDAVSWKQQSSGFQLSADDSTFW